MNSDNVAFISKKTMKTVRAKLRVSELQPKCILFFINDHQKLTMAYLGVLRIEL